MWCCQVDYRGSQLCWKAGLTGVVRWKEVWCWWWTEVEMIYFLRNNTKTPLVLKFMLISCKKTLFQPPPWWPSVPLVTLLHTFLTWFAHCQSWWWWYNGFLHWLNPQSQPSTINSAWYSTHHSDSCNTISFSTFCHQSALSDGHWLFNNDATYQPDTKCLWSSPHPSQWTQEHKQQHSHCCLASSSTCGFGCNMVYDLEIDWMLNECTNGQTC